MTSDTIPAHPDRHAEQQPDRIAYVMAHSGEAVTYRRLVEASRRIAAVLRGRGVRQGDAVAILIENHPRFMEVAWAAQRSGLRYTAISTRLTPDEIGYILRDSGAVALFASAKCSQAAPGSACGCPGGEGSVQRGFGCGGLRGSRGARHARTGRPASR